MQLQARNGGFTLVEIMIVGLVVDILAMISRASLLRVRLRTRASACLNASRGFGAACNQYAQEKGEYSSDNWTHSFPPELTGYISNTRGPSPTSLGGYFDWDNLDAWNNLGVHFRAALRINGGSMSLEPLRKIDGWIDDENRITGNFRITDAGFTASPSLIVSRQS